jgi:hypothetical protein
LGIGINRFLALLLYWQVTIFSLLWRSQDFKLALHTARIAGVFGI